MIEDILPLAVFNTLDLKDDRDHIKYYAAREAEPLLPKLEAVPDETKTLICVVPVEGRIGRKALYKLDQKLEDLITARLPEEWSADLYFIQKREGGGFTRILTEAGLLIHKLSFYYPYETIIQLSGTGDAECFQAIFLESTKQLGSRHGFLFYSEGKAEISLSRQAVSDRSLKLQVKGSLREFDFQGALELVKGQPAPEPLRLMLKMMVSRMNFCFSEAHQHAVECERLLKDEPAIKETRLLLEKLLSKEGREQDLALIEELYRQMEVCIEIDDMAAFLTRFYRAREAILTFLLKHGSGYQEEEPMKNNSSIYQLIEELEKRYEEGEIEEYMGAYFYLKSLNVAHTLRVRNQSFIGHGREEINSEELWHSYFGNKRASVSRVKKRFLLESNLMLRDLGAELDDNYTELMEIMLQMDLDFEERGQREDETSRVLQL
ncbi:hypothetical protein [Peribacillus sp. SCS-37]|uniref:hypothetical protein n=1 Tax=Paraperibacillus esterisolvens TaxID=3115296 RepID=UPI0039068C67